MKLETFFEKFDLFSSVSDAANKIRQLVLEFGVLGRFTDGSDVWPEVSLGEVVRLRRGYDLPTQVRRSGKYPIYAANGIVGFHDEHVAAGPGVVTGRSGSIGKVHFVPVDFWPLNTALYVEEFFGNDPQFACLLLRSLHLERFSTATAVPTLNRNVVHKEKVRVPPLAEQKRIVAKVDELMALCDRLEAQQKERETRHTSLARASLARFADSPTPANLQFLFHKSYDISPGDLRKAILTLGVCGHLSDGAGSGEWTSVPMKDVCLQITDGEHATPQRTSTGVPLATAKNVRDGFLDLTHTDYVAESTAEKCWRRCKPRDQDVLMVCVGATTGRVCLTRNPPDIVLVRSVALIRPNTNRIEPTFLDLFLRSPVGQSQIWSNVKQSAQPCLYLGKMAEFEIALPHLADQRRIVAKVDRLMTLVDQLEAQLEVSRDKAAKLLEAIVAGLTEPPNSIPRQGLTNAGRTPLWYQK